MNQDFFPTLMVLMGSVVLMFAMKSNRTVFSFYKMIPRAKRRTFKQSLIILNSLIGFFLIAYLLLAYLILAHSYLFEEFLIAALILSGAVFVYISSRLNARMLGALSATIETLIPMCAWCKKIRVTNPEGPKWLNSDQFLEEKGVGEVTHGICPKCRMENHLDEGISESSEKPLDRS